MDLSLLTGTVVLSNTLLRWAIAGLIALAALIGLRTARGLVRRRLPAIARRNRTRVDDVLVDVLSRTRGWTIFALALYAGSQALVLPERYAVRLGQLLALVLVVQAAIWGDRALDRAIREAAAREDLDPGRRTTLGALRFVGRLTLYALLLLVALENLGVDITALVAGLGITSIAVALALQNILGDLFASLSIVFDKPFEVGDFIVVGDLPGTVERVGLRTTRVRALSGEQLVFANNDLLSSRIRNFKRMAERRVVFAFGVEYGTPSEALRRIPALCREAVEAQEPVRFDRAHFKDFGASSLDFEVVYYVLTSDFNLYMDVQQAINLHLYARFEEEGIAFAFPTQTVHLESSAGLPRNPEGAPASAPPASS